VQYRRRRESSIPHSMREMPDLLIFLIGCVLPMFVLLIILLPMFFKVRNDETKRPPA
jgi:hypothetical protein